MDIFSNIQLIKTTLENKLQPFVNDSTQIQMIHRNPLDLDFIIHIKKKNTEDRTIKFCCSLKKSRSGVMCDYYSSDNIWTEPQTFNITDNKKWKSILEDLFPESKTTKKKQQTTRRISTQGGGAATATQGGGGGNTMQQQKQQKQQTKK